MKWAVPASVVAALAAGVLGYALTGSPREPAAPAPPRVTNERLDPEGEQASRALLENFGDIRAWLTLSDALLRAGRTETAVAAIESGLEANPQSPDLWVQLGIALVAHANGEVVPAARLAFDRASLLAPDHPAPAYFLGLAWLQSAEPARAIEVWRSLLNRSAPDAPWRPMIERQLGAAEMMMAMGVGEGRMPGGPMMRPPAAPSAQPPSPPAG
ncbi:MAG: tetratricopeptide repeat protein [Sphingomonadaceae bacterium]